MRAVHQSILDTAKTEFACYDYLEGLLTDKKVTLAHSLSNKSCMTSSHHCPITGNRYLYLTYWFNNLFQYSTKNPFLIRS